MDISEKDQASIGCCHKAGLHDVSVEGCSACGIYHNRPPRKLCDVQRPSGTWPVLSCCGRTFSAYSSPHLDFSVAPCRQLISGGCRTSCIMCAVSWFRVHRSVLQCRLNTGSDSWRAAFIQLPASSLCMPLAAWHYVPNTSFLSTGLLSLLL